MISKNWSIIALTILTVTFFPQLVCAEEPLTLQQSIEIALKNSAIINIAKENSKGATAQKKEAMTGFLPKFSTTYSYMHLSEDPFIRVPSFSLFKGYWQTPSFDIPAGTANNYNWSIEVKQPLFTGGAIQASYQASKIGEEASRLEEAVKYQDVVQQVKITYFNILRAQKIQEAAQQAVEMLKAHRDIVQNLFTVGMIPKNDLLQADVVLANGNQALIKAKNAVDLAKSYFNTILKRNISVPVEVVDILAYQPMKISFEECVNIARQSRPELKISSLRAAQAGKLVKVAQSEYFPSLGMVGNYSRYGDNPSVSGSDYKDQESWYVMAVASWNFWEWGKTKFRVDNVKARENQALEAARELNNQIVLEIRNAYLMLLETESQIAVSQKLIEQATENFRIAEDRYKVRVATSTDVLDAQTLLTKAKSEYANALGDYNINYAKLEKAMGTIWKTEEENLKTTDNLFAEQKQKNSSDANVAVSTVAVNSASVSNEQSVTKPLPEKDVRNLVDKWLSSWQSGNMETYRNCYASDFNFKGMDLNAWISYKTKVHQKNKNVNIRIENLQILSDATASTAVAIFTQYYSSSILKDKAQKTLMLIKVNGEWKITGEKVDPLY